MMTSAANTFGKSSTTVFLTAGSPPTVSAQRSVSGGIMTVGVYVVEFDPAEVKVQQGSGVRVQRGVFESYALNVDTQTDTLSPALNPQSTMVWNGFGGAAGIMMADSGTNNYMPAAHQRVYQVDATTVRGDRAMTDDIAEGSWEAVEWEATLAVELAAFAASGADGAVELSWETASELDNLGFHLYRAPASEGPWERITRLPSPGLGSSAHGARYRYLDREVANGALYWYELEDIDLTGATTRHGPVSGTPYQGATLPVETSTPEVTVGAPSDASFRVLAQDDDGMVVQLTTSGFTASALDDGSVRIELDGFVNDSKPGLPDVPVFRSWLSFPSRKVEIVSVAEEGVEVFSSLTPQAAPEHEVVASGNGTVTLRPRPHSGVPRAQNGIYPEALAQIVRHERSKASKGALLELAPIRRFDPESGLVVSRTLTVKLAFSRPGPGRDRAGSRARRGRRNRRQGDVVATLVVKDPGLYAVTYEQLFGTRYRRSVDASTLRLTYQGDVVPVHLEPEGDFERGSVLYFHSAGALALNPYGPAALFHRLLLESMTDGRHPRLGDAVLEAQSAYVETGLFPELVRIYNLFGDPALSLR